MRIDEIDLTKYEEKISNVVEHCRQLNIDVCAENFRYRSSIGLVLESDNILSRLFPEISVDKEGLSSFSELTKIFRIVPLNHGYFETDKFAIMAHPYFRRGFTISKSYPSGVLTRLWRRGENGSKWSLALDQNRVKVKLDEGYIVEKDYWYGPKFNKKIESVVDGVVKHHIPIDLDEEMSKIIFNDAISIDIKWSTRGNLKSFQAEELLSSKKIVYFEGNSYHPMRYAHACNYNTQTSMFEHLDGAVHLYSGDEYEIRKHSDINHNFKNEYHIKAKSIKLFKIENNISNADFSNVVAEYFTGNMLIIEYFDGELPIEIIKILGSKQ